MITDTLNELGIPYIVVMYKVHLCEISYDQYMIMTDVHPELSSLGFHYEHEIKRYRKKYMCRDLSSSEAKAFTAKGFMPKLINEYGCTWEFNGKVARYKREYNRHGKEQINT